MSRKISILGTWHQGSVAAACFAEYGYIVYGIDENKENVEALKKGKAPLFEPELNALLEKGIKNKKLFFSNNKTKVKETKEVCIMFDTPVDEHDKSDLAPLWKTIKEITPHLQKDTLIWVTAQVPVGTCEMIKEKIDKRNPKIKVKVAYTPENLRLGQAIQLFQHPVLPVIGANDKETFERTKEFLLVITKDWEHVSLRTGEMVKHGLNAFLGMSIAFGNELGNICDEVHVDGKRVAEVLRKEPRIGSKAMLFPGLGFSGGTIARDIQTLRGIAITKKLGTPLLDGIWTANEKQNKIIVRKLKQHYASLSGKKIAVLGLTYKPETSTLRRSAALEVISMLKKEGAIIQAHDPKADRKEVKKYKQFTFFEDVYAALKGADACVVITPWKEYKNIDFKKMKKSMNEAFFIDPNNMFEKKEVEEKGFMYTGIGRGN